MIVYQVNHNSDIDELFTFHTAVSCREICHVPYISYNSYTTDEFACVSQSGNVVDESQNIHKTVM